MMTRTALTPASPGVRVPAGRIHRFSLRPHLLWLGAAAIAGFLLCWPSTALTALRDCRGLSEAGYKVLIDEPSHAGAAFASDEDRRVFMGRLAFALETMLEEKTRDEIADAIAEGQLHFLECYGRTPRGKADFTSDTVDVLHTRKAVLEVVGTLSGETRDGRPVGEALIHYIVVPLRFDFFRDRVTLDGTFSAQYHITSTGASPYPEWLNVFKEGNHLDAFLFTGLGLQAQNDRNHDLAVASFCTAAVRLDSIAGRTTRKSLKRQAAQLGSYVRERAGQVVKNAKADAGYVQRRGALILLDEKAPCPPGQS